MEDSCKILKFQKRKSNQNWTRKNNKHNSDKPRHTSLHSKELSNYKKTAGCSQWPAQPSAGKSDCPGRRSQRRLRPSCLHPPAWRGCPSNSHIGLQLLDASLNVQPSVLQLRLLEQRLLVFQVRTLPIPPVTNKEKLATYRIRKNEKKLPHIYQGKSILQKNKILPQTTAHQES